MRPMMLLLHVALLLALGCYGVAASVTTAVRPLSVVCFSHGTIVRAYDNPLLEESRRSGVGSVLPVYIRGNDAFAQDSSMETVERAGLQSLAFKIGGRLAICDSSDALGALLRTARDEGFDSMQLLYVNSSVVASPKLELSLLSAVAGSGVDVKTIAMSDDLFTGSDAVQSGIEVQDINDLRFDKYRGRYARLEKRVVAPAAGRVETVMAGLTNVLLGSMRERASTVSRISLLDGDAAPVIVTGEDLALRVVTEYVNSDDISFSDKYRHLYVDEFSTSTEHRLSLARLANTTSAYTHFFQGEVIGSYIARFLAEGTLSPRLLVHSRALLAKSLTKRYESPLVCRLRSEAVRKDWHAFVSRNAMRLHKDRSDDSSWRYSYSRFQGHLMREATMGESSQGGPWIVFVHGFGGSLEQSTQLSKALLRKNKKLRISALDLMGFGHSEKVPISINQYFWRDQVVRFLETSRQGSEEQSSVILMGNSIGGFIAAAAAAHISESGNPRVRCEGLILCNSAGQINGEGLAETDINSLFPPYKGPSGELLRLFGKGVFSLLQPRIQQTCEWLYPTNPAPVREGTAANILRDSCDLGAEDIIAAGGKLPKPEPFNSLLRKFEGRVLVTQGVLDPLNDARSRAAQISRIRNDITVDLVQAGHCPMEELPEEVADSIIKWINNI